MKEHDGCKGCKYESESEHSPYCQGCKQNAIDKYVRKTNRDLLDEMDNYELAGVLGCPYKDGICLEADCKECIQKWLITEV